MHAEIGDGNFSVEVIGDFPEEEARQFAEYALTGDGIGRRLTETDWHGIYEVRNGSKQSGYCTHSIHTTDISCDDVLEASMKHCPAGLSCTISK